MASGNPQAAAMICPQNYPKVIVEVFRQIGAKCAAALTAR
jgi:hypothetical protein